MVDVLAGHFLKIETALAYIENVLDVWHGDLQVGSTHLQDFLTEPQQVKSQLIPVLFWDADDDDLFENDL